MHDIPDILLVRRARSDQIHMPDIAYAFLFFLTFAGLALALIARAIADARGTTLVAPMVWALVALLLLVVDAAMSSGTDGMEAKFQAIAATATFCPLVSLLGAKRPQHRAWQWIVLSLWAVAALPAIESLIVHPN